METALTAACAAGIRRGVIESRELITHVLFFFFFFFSARHLPAWLVPLNFRKPRSSTRRKRHNKTFNIRNIRKTAFASGNTNCFKGIHS